jgi:hypothetical protein
LRHERVVGYTARAFDRLVDVFNDAVAPASDLVSEGSQRPDPATADRAFADDAPLPATPIRDRSLLDHKPTVRRVDDERRVVKVATPASVKCRDDSFIDATVQSDRVAARSERQPVQIRSV